MKTNSLAAALLGGAGTLVLASVASAQAAQKADDTESLQEVVVTGSRVITNGNNSPTPVTVVQMDELMQLQPTTVSDALNNLPVFQGSRGQFSLPNTTGLYGGGNPATTQLNLRNLAPQRTLILFDGQRVAPTNALGIVDVDMVPQELIQRVDVVTGGVSAVYGSDAIAGVVNFITDKNFNGFRASGSYGISERHDDQGWKVGFAAGTKLFDGRGHIELSYNHFDNNGLPHRNARDYFRYSLLGSTPGSTAPSGTVANPYGLFYDVHNSQTTPGGKISNGALNGQQFVAAGILGPFINGAATGTANSQIGGDGTIGGINSFKAPVKFDQVFLRFDFDVTDAVHFHTEGAGNWKVDTTYSGLSNFNNQTYSTSNAFLPANIKSQMGTAATFTMSKQYAQIAPLTQISNVSNFFVNAGLDGKFGKYTWSADLNYGDNKINDVFENNINNRKMAAALDAVVNPANGQIVCNASLTNSAYADCVPLNNFGPNSQSAAAIRYITETTHLIPRFKQIEVGGQISGEIFNLPAGPVNGAASVEWRKQTFSQDADALPTSFATCTNGLRTGFNCSATTAEYQTAFAVGSPKSQSVKEGALEFDAPLLKDMTAFKSLNLNGAVRYTAYDVGGKAWTWKAGLDWHINDSVRFRATQSKDIEAPTLGMVFQPLLVAFINNQDILTGQSNQVPAYNTGSPDVVSETGHTTTAGIVWTPQSLPGFSVSLDGYHITVDGALTQIQGQAPTIQQACYDSKGASQFCQLQIRPTACFDQSNPACTVAANSVTRWIDIFQNASNLETYGADLEVNYATRLFGRAASMRLLTTWQPHYLYQAPGAPEYDFGDVAFPNLVPLQNVPAVQLTATLNYSFTDNLSVGVTERWRSAMRLEPKGLVCGSGATQVQCIFPSGPPAYYTTNLNVDYKVGSRAGTAVFLNVRNLFDKLATPLVGLSGANGYAQSEDPVGRYYTVGFRVQL